MSPELMRQVDEAIYALELLRRRVKWDDDVVLQMREKAQLLQDLLLSDLVWDEGL